MPKKRKPKQTRRFGSKTRATRRRMWFDQGYKCGICQKVIRQRILFTDRVNIDHIRPRAHGGSSFPDNLQLVHMVCNQQKAASCDGCEFCNTPQLD